MIGDVDNGIRRRITLPFYTGDAGVRDRGGTIELAFVLPNATSSMTRKDALIAAASGAKPVEATATFPCVGTVGGDQVRAVSMRRSDADARLVIVTATWQ